ncbi:MAG: DNA repair exonuclease [Actinobacteria bacterium]|nr:DNA repair exonuclease [Actinomycetota bacterium]MCL5446723.1 DNA repair exonuclease [Actinomycetota bacterium]
MKFRFIHAADLHLDTPFKGVGKVNPTIAEALRDASIAAFDNLIDLALQQQVAFVILAGDIYDGAERGVRAQLRFLAGLKRLDNAGIRSFIAHGNHDPVEAGWSAIREWPRLVTVFAHNEVQVETVAIDGADVATVHGISFAQREESENLALRFAGGRGTGLQIGVLHCNVGKDSDHAPYAPCTLDDLVNAGLDYWALGHIHKRSILRDNHPWVVYPGNIQGRSSKPSESGAKGAYVVEVDGTSIQSVEFVPLDAIRFEHIYVSVSDISDLPGMQDNLQERAAELYSQAGSRAIILDASITGSGPVHDDLSREGVLDETLQSLRDASGDYVPFLWWNQLHDETSPTLDLEKIRQRNDFAGELLSLADNILDQENSMSSLSNELLSDLPKRKLETAGVMVPDIVSPALWWRATIHALELLLEERESDTP